MKFLSSIDQVLVINLDHRKDRWSEFCQKYEGRAPLQIMRRVPAVYGPDIRGFGQPPWFRQKKRDRTWAARAGCVLSHRKALLLARQEGWGNILILEDDASFIEGFSQEETTIAQGLANFDAFWDVCYLAFSDPDSPCRMLGHIAPGQSMHQIYGCNSTFAYMIKPAARDWILARLPEPDNVWPWLARNRAIDYWYRRTLGRHFNVACISPGLVVHSAGFSDIVGRSGDAFGDNNHVTSLPETSMNKAAFEKRRRLQCFRSVFADGYDAARGIGKRFLGF